MYLGRIMEQGTTEQVFSPPYHPYTEALLSAVPIADTSIKKKHIVLTGELPSPMNPPPGCPFQTRCPRKIGPICETELPPNQEFASGHKIMCHLPADDLRKMEPVFAMARKAVAGPAMKKIGIRKSGTRKPGVKDHAARKVAAEKLGPKGTHR